MDGFLGKSDPFYTIKRIDDPGSLAETLTTVYSSPVIDNDFNPAWPKAKLALSKVSPPPGSNKCELLFEVWDKDFISDDCIGVARLNLQDIKSGLEVPLLPDARRASADPEAYASSTLGTLIFEKCHIELKHFKGSGQSNPNLLRYYAHRVWKLPVPDVVISITSGLTDYNLESSTEDRLLYDMMEMTNTRKTWLLTNGTCKAFAQRVGYYRAKYAVTTPLIGFASTPKPTQPASLQSYAAEWTDYVDKSLDQNHSHFILSSNGDEAGMLQTKLRSDLEACIGKNVGWLSMEREIDNMLAELEVGWPEADDPSTARIPAGQRPGIYGTMPCDIPVVKMCVQGGSSSVRTMLNSVNESLPVLLVRGTGKAADLVADAVCLKFPEGHVKHLEKDLMTFKQKHLFEFLDQMRHQAGQVLPRMNFYKDMDAYDKDKTHPWKNKDRSINPPFDDPSGQGYRVMSYLL